MKRPPLSLPILLLSLHSSSAAEAWLLEMDSRFHEALMKRFATGDPAACRQVTDKLPELVKSGQVKELEWISTDSATGGRVHPEAKFIRKLKSGEEAPMDVGTTYTGGSGSADQRSFRIKSAGEGLGAALDITVTGRLGKAWQPVFSSESGGIVRVFLEREPAAEEEFCKPRGLLALSAPIPGKTTFTWILGEGHPLLPMEDREATETPALAGYQETVTRPAKSGSDWRDFGTIIKWSFTPATGPAFDLSPTLEEKGASAAARAFLAKGGLGNATAPARFPITTFVEKVD